jgi:hypothetical protein
VSYWDEDDDTAGDVIDQEIRRFRIHMDEVPRVVSQTPRPLTDDQVKEVQALRSALLRAIESAQAADAALAALDTQ